MEKFLKSWIGLVLLPGFVVGDLPIHCPIDNVVGLWHIKSVSSSFHDNYLFDRRLVSPAPTIEFSVNLNNQRQPNNVNTDAQVLNLPYQAVVTLLDGLVSASWSMIYDEGLVIQLEFQDYFLIFYGPFAYDTDPKFTGKPSAWVQADGSTPGYISHCGTIREGWVIKKNKSSPTVTTTWYFSGSLKEKAQLAIPFRAAANSAVGQLKQHVKESSYLPVEHIPSNAIKYTKQGDCGSCFILAFAHAFEATWARRSLPPVVVDREALLACSYSSQGCNGGYYQSLILDLMVTGLPVSGCMDGNLDSLSGKTQTAQTCALPCFDKPEKPLVFPAGFVELRTQARIEDWLSKVGPVPIAVSLPAVAPDSAAVTIINNAVKGSWSYVSHAVVLLGWGQTPQGLRYWEVYNPWGGAMTRMKIARSEYDGIIEQFAIGIKIG